MKTQINYYVILSIERYKQKGDKFLPTLTQLKPGIVKYPLFYATDNEIEQIDDDLKRYARKYCGLLTAKQLIEFLEQSDFTETCSTLGSITIEFGWIPAISFSVCDHDYGLNAYVSPIICEKSFIEEYDKLPEERQKQKAIYINKLMYDCMKFLENEVLENYPIEIPEKYTVCNIDLQQLEISEFLETAK